MSNPKKDAVIYVRTTRLVKEAIERAAEKEDRSEANWVLKTLANADEYVRSALKG